MDYASLFKTAQFSKILQKDKKKKKKQAWLSVLYFKGLVTTLQLAYLM